MSGPANTILVEPADGQQRVIEKPAAGAIRPGDVVAVNSSNEFVAAGAVLVNASKSFALENIADAGGIADDYVANDRVRALYAQPGDLVNCTLADSNTISVGDPLETGAAGSVTAWSAGTLIGHAEEDVTTSGAEARLLVRVA